MSWSVKYVIIGEIKTHSGTSCFFPPERYRIASFDLIEDAESYIKKSKLKSGRYSKKSLLGLYDAAWIETEEIIPHNPTIKVK